MSSVASFDKAVVVWAKKEGKITILISILLYIRVLNMMMVTGF